ncbi:hypothetical protein L210DRAFT_938821 [Boletus edulis BED1]|uniref:Uncharacterized protein n=1 Tax=Boletus edulis BED1 TaxID=1328754 RepID=A0AAD4G4S7_BOLED|nr:hypothetical protein L210DRAFT_938821 [Boletus edulis BED1]
MYLSVQKPRLKLTHSLFELKPKDTETAQDEVTEPTNSTGTTGTTIDENDDDLSPEFAMETWPVSDRVNRHFKELFVTHDICALITYDANKKVILPTNTSRCFAERLSKCVLLYYMY